MKQITVKSCGECPYCVATVLDDGFECANPKPVNTYLKVCKDTIHPDCPLSDVPTREEAFSIIMDVVSDDITVNQALDKLGFTEKAKEK